MKANSVKLKKRLLFLENSKESKIKFDVHAPNDKLNERLK